MYPLTRAPRANGPQAHGQSAADDKLIGAAGPVASPAPLLSCRFGPRLSLINRPAVHEAGIPNQHNPIFEHPVPPLWRSSPTHSGTTPGWPSLISINHKSHNTKEIPLRLGVSASNPIHPNPRIPNDP